mmetsp:Transcript_57409/g.168089  ORF Transcript_57409/g.168089 Transcript_57409/m.168089 type:complete len:294 (+) Transcript_57409:65-946(+)
MDTADAALDHVRAARDLGVHAAQSGRHEDSWKILKRSAKAAVAASPKGVLGRRLQHAMDAAQRHGDPQQRALVMQQVFDEVLSKQTHLSRPGTSSHEVVATAAERARPGTGLKRSPSLPASRPTTRPGSPALHAGVRESLPDPCLGPAHLRGYLQAISKDPRAVPVYRAASAPYFEATPHAKEAYFSGAETENGQVTSHYTKLGAPKSNSHYKNTLPGANVDFHDADRYQTSNSVFYGKAQDYKVPSTPVRRDPNFQYVNGDPRQGLATWHRAALPGYHRTRAEVNGLGIGAR